MVNGQLPKPGEGPSKAEREGGCYDLLFIAEAADGRTLRTSVASKLDAGGGSTAAIVGESAVCLAREISRETKSGGIWTSASLMGNALIARLKVNAEMTFGVES